MNNKAMRDALIEGIVQKMSLQQDIFFLAADFGAPALDEMRSQYPERFINVGIAEQNLINVATGLALEGFKVFAYAIAPFLTMRAYEQIRTNISIMSQAKGVNINLIGVGAGLSYDVTGPTHHCLEDISIINTLPNIDILSPSDSILMPKILDYCLNHNNPKYLRLDGKTLPSIYNQPEELSITDGLYLLKEGRDALLMSTGYMTHKALRVANMLLAEGIDIAVMDSFLLKPMNVQKLKEAIDGYRYVITLEESFVGKAGFDSMISGMIRKENLPSRFLGLGFSDKYVFDVGDREYLHSVNGLSIESISNTIKDFLRGKSVCQS